MRRPASIAACWSPAAIQLGELRLELLQLGLEVDQAFEHVARLRARSARPRRV